ncbi:MAG: hypothetical protein D6791_08030, partial [Chloroflexi bacterium]
MGQAFEPVLKFGLLPQRGGKRSMYLGRKEKEVEILHLIGASGAEKMKKGCPTGGCGEKTPQTGREGIAFD